MKKLLILCIACVLPITMTMVSVFATDNIINVNTINYSVKAVQGDTSMEYEVLFRGTTSAGSQVSLDVQKAGTSVLIEQFTADNTGVFSFSLRLYDEGNYTVYMNDYINNVPVSKDFQLLSKTSYEGIATALNGADGIDAVLTALNPKDTDIGLDKQYYTADMQNAVATEMLNHKGKFTAYNLTELFDESVIRAYLCHQENRGKAEEIISYYDSYLNIKSQTEPKSLYNDYQQLSTTVKNQILADAFDALSSLDKAAESFNFAAAKNVIVLLDNESVDPFITNNNDYYKFEGYEDLDTLQKKSVLDALKKADLGNSQQDLTEAYTQIMNPNVEEEDEDKGGRAPGGAGSFNTNTVTPGPQASYGTESLPEPPQTTSTATVTFNDLDDVAWASDAILALAKKGIVNGKGDQIFAPNDSITREEYAKILSLTFDFYDSNAETEFTDVDKAYWAYRYIASTQKEGYILGYPDGGFHGGEAISRQDMAVILYRILSKTKVIPLQGQYTNPFSDYSEISEYAQNAVLMLYNAQIISGVTPETFEPQREATRAEICVLLNRVLAMINE